MRSFVLACSFLLACSEVTIVPNDGGGSADDGVGGDTSVGAGTPSVGGAGGSGGAPVPEPRLIEIALVGPQDGDIASVGVLVNRADGSLRTSYPGSELPVMAEVVDGDMVSFSVPDFDEEETRLSSYRVRPSVSRIAEYGPTTSAACEALEPMSVTLEIPIVDGADGYRIHSRNQVHTVEPGVQTIEIDACTTDGPEPLLVAAGKNFNNELLAYEFLEVSYMPGAAVTLPLELVTHRQDIALLTSGEELWINGWWTPILAPFPFGGSNPYDWQPTADGYAASLIAPGGGYAWMNVAGPVGSAANGFCTNSHQQLRIASIPGPVTVDASVVDLAQPILLEDDSVAFADDGPRGDFLYRWFYNDVDVFVWELYDDPAAEWLPAVFPELPAGDPWNLDPGGPLVSRGVTHIDYDVHAGYADFVAKLETTMFSPTRTRSVGACE